MQYDVTVLFKSGARLTLSPVSAAVLAALLDGLQRCRLGGERLAFVAPDRLTCFAYEDVSCVTAEPRRKGKGRADEEAPWGGVPSRHYGE